MQNPEAGASLVSTFTNLGIGKEDGERVVGKDWERTELVKRKLSPLSLQSTIQLPLPSPRTPHSLPSPSLVKQAIYLFLTCEIFLFISLSPAW